MKRVPLYILCLFFMNGFLHAQDSTEIQRYPVFDIHLGVGWVSGGRIGGRMQMGQDISVEASIGNHIANFISLSDEETKFGIGVNWHRFVHPNLTLSILGAYGEKIHLRPNDLYLLSLNIGYLSLKHSGLNFFARTGPFIGIKKNYAGTSNVLGFNLDFGVGWVFL